MTKWIRLPFQHGFENWGFSYRQGQVFLFTTGFGAHTLLSNVYEVLHSFW